MKFQVLVAGGRELQNAVATCFAENPEAALWQCSTEEKLKEALARTPAPDLILIDFDLHQLKPLKLLSQLLATGEKRNVVLVAAAPAIEDVVKCLHLGASDFLQYPREKAKLQTALRDAFARWEKNQKGAAFGAQLHDRFDVQGLIGESPQMQQVVQTIKKISQRRWVTVLIRGETGTGKELVARAIHYGSAETPANAPFVEVNCTAIPENLLEAELFGYEKGAFTDAKFSKKGLFEIAEGGTLFLDEIGDMSLLLQAKLLKAIEEKRIRRLGGTQSLEVKTRIMAGTHAHLEKAIEEGRFRRDLYYRLNVITLALPPLRERGRDILVLAHHFLAAYAREYQTPAQKLTPAAEQALMQYDWPGNVRELKHVLERAVLLSENAAIDVPDIHEALGVEPRPRAASPKLAEGALPWSRAIEIPPEGLSLRDGECRLIEEVLRLTKWNKTRASQILGISRPRLARKIEEYKIQAQPRKAFELTAV